MCDSGWFLAFKWNGPCDCTLCVCPALSADCHKPLNMTPCLISWCVRFEERNGWWVCSARRINGDVYRSYCLKWRFAQPLSVTTVQNCPQPAATKSAWSEPWSCHRIADICGDPPCLLVRYRCSRERRALIPSGGLT